MAEKKAKRTSKPRESKLKKTQSAPEAPTSTSIPATQISHELNQLSYQGIDIQSMLPSNDSIRPDPNTSRLNDADRQQDKLIYAEQLNAAANVSDRSKVAKAWVEAGTAQELVKKAIVENSIASVEVETAVARHQQALSLRDSARVKTEELQEKVIHAEISRDGIRSLTEELRTQARKRLELEQARTKKIENQIASTVSAYEAERAKLLGGDI